MQTHEALAGINRTIAAALAPHLNAAADLRRAAYLTALYQHDWLYQYADDYMAYSRGATQRAWLMLEAAQVDADFGLWNSVAPAGQRRLQPDPPDVRGAVEYVFHLADHGTPPFRGIPMASKQFAVPLEALRHAHSAAIATQLA